MLDPPILLYVHVHESVILNWLLRNVECVLPCAVCWQSSFWLTQCVCLMGWEATSLSLILATDVHIQLNKGNSSLYTITILKRYLVPFLDSYVHMYMYMYVKTNLFH